MEEKEELKKIMRSIDIHAHIIPGQISEIRNGGDWHGFTYEEAERAFLVRDAGRNWLHPKLLWSPEQRLAEMDSVGVDVHVLSTWTQLYNYDLPVEVCTATSRDCNDYVAELVKQWPERFSGLPILQLSFQAHSPRPANSSLCLSKVAEKTLWPVLFAEP